jgi:hypothetical protein
LYETTRHYGVIFTVSVTNGVSHTILVIALGDSFYVRNNAKVNLEKTGATLFLLQTFQFVQAWGFHFDPETRQHSSSGKSRVPRPKKVHDNKRSNPLRSFVSIKEISIMNFFFTANSQSASQASTVNSS